MTVRVISTLPDDLLPMICVCQGCRKESEVTEYSDFTHKTLTSGMDAEPSDEVFVRCPLCHDFAFPKHKKAELISAYELWKHTDPQSYQKIWSKQFRCPACKKTSTITIENVKVINTAVAYAGETWEPEVCVICPICQSHTGAKGQAPQGILDSVLHEAESKRNR